jgi:hypothetical protein
MPAFALQGGHRAQPAEQHQIYIWPSPLDAGADTAAGRMRLADKRNQSTHLNWYVVEQLPILTLTHYVRPIQPMTLASGDRKYRTSVNKPCKFSNFLVPLSRGSAIELRRLFWDCPTGFAQANGSGLLAVTCWNDATPIAVDVVVPHTFLNCSGLARYFLDKRRMRFTGT